MATEAYVQPIKARRDLGAIASRVLGLLLVVLVLVWLGVNLVKTPDDFGRVLLIGPATYVFDADLSDEWARAAGLPGIPAAAASGRGA